MKKSKSTKNVTSALKDTKLAADDDMIRVFNSQTQKMEYYPRISRKRGYYELPLEDCLGAVYKRNSDGKNND